MLHFTAKPYCSPNCSCTHAAPCCCRTAAAACCTLHCAALSGWGCARRCSGRVFELTTPPRLTCHFQRLLRRFMSTDESEVCPMRLLVRLSGPAVNLQAEVGEAGFSVFPPCSRGVLPNLPSRRYVALTALIPSPLGADGAQWRPGGHDAEPAARAQRADARYGQSHQPDGQGWC